MKASPSDALTVFKALSDPTRLRIVRLLAERDLCVCELTFILKMSQSRVSHQLRILRDAGLVRDKRDRRWMIYGIPTSVGNILRPLLALVSGGESRDESKRARDLEALEICLREDVRRSGPKGRASGTPAARRET